jgi:hypothetical protein
MAEVEITKDDFQAYVNVQMSGVTNMFAVTKVSELSGLTKEQCFDIMKNYRKYADEFNINKE